MWYQSLIEEIHSIRSSFQQDSSFSVRAINLWVSFLGFWFWGFGMKSDRNTHLVFDSDHFLTLILIFRVKIMPGFGFIWVFCALFHYSGTRSVGSRACPIRPSIPCLPTPSRAFPRHPVSCPTFPCIARAFWCRARALPSRKHVQYNPCIWYCTWNARQIYVSNPRFPRASRYAVHFSEGALCQYIYIYNLSGRSPLTPSVNPVAEPPC